MFKVHVVHTAAHRLGESMTWHAARQCWLWVDLLDPCLCQLQPGQAVVRRALPLKPPIGSISATTDPDRVLIAHLQGLSLLHLDTLQMEAFCNPEGGRDQVISNDIKCDRWGRLWFGTSHAREIEPRGALWCVTGDGRAFLGDAGFPVSNGPAFSPDGSIMYFNDSANRRTYAYDIKDNSLLPMNRRVMAQYREVEGLPDGLTVDARGHVWSAQWLGGRIIELAPDGTQVRHIPVPAANVTSLAFGGPDYRTLMITSATDGLSAETLDRYPQTGSVFEAEPGVAGLPEPLFKL